MMVIFLLKLLNPFIWFINVFNYSAHLNYYAELSNRADYEYEPYDFSRDLRYY